eukprot:COSAG01_NODE_1000_length_12213_cov_20.853063_11_plen_71_part_00
MHANQAATNVVNQAPISSPNRLACRWGAACWPLWLLVVRGSVRPAVNTDSDFRFQISDLRIDRSHSLFLQ